MLEALVLNNVYCWLILLVLMIVIEFATMGLTTIWFAAGALIALIVALAGGNLVLQIAFFIGVSVCLLYFTRPWAMRFFNRDRTRTNADMLIGKKGIVLTEIDNLQGTGLINVGGQEWTARSNQDDKVIKQGNVVTVIAIAGVKAIVDAASAEDGTESDVTLAAASTPDHTKEGI
ncbi:MAG: NfeD family protein [Lachnospiraceae bacterium]|nr:NfeD family protein [Lachnospiraceae bacterium]